MKNLFFLLALILLSAPKPTKAQDYDHRVLAPNSTEMFNDMIYVTMNNVRKTYQVGSIDGFAAVRCMDENGLVEWTNIYGPANSRYTQVVVERTNLMIVGTIGQVGNNQTPDILVTKINRLGTVVYNRSLSSSQIPGAVRIAAEQISTGLNAGCWVGFRCDDGSGLGNSDEIRLVNLNAQGQFGNAFTFSSGTNDTDLRALSFDGINNEVLTYWTTPADNNHYLTAIDVTGSQITTTTTVPGPSGGGVYNTIKSRSQF